MPELLREHRRGEPDGFGAPAALLAQATPAAPARLVPPPPSPNPDSVAGVLQELDSVFRNDLHAEAPAPDTDLLGSGLIDSMALVMLLLAIEDRFGTKLDLAKLSLDDIRSPLTIAAAIAVRLNRPPRQLAV